MHIPGFSDDINHQESQWPGRGQRLSLQSRFQGKELVSLRNRLKKKLWRKKLSTTNYGNNDKVMYL